MDRNAIGIRNVFDIQRNRLLPMPTYDLSEIGRVAVTLYGTVLNEDYSRLLASNRNLDLVTVLLLDLVQKGLPVTKEQSRLLHEQGLVRGRYPKLTVSAEVAAATGAHSEYVRNKGVDNSVFKELILELLRVRPCSSRTSRAWIMPCRHTLRPSRRRPCNIAPKPTEGGSHYQRRKHFGLPEWHITE